MLRKPPSLRAGGSHRGHTALPWRADRCHPDWPCCCAGEAPRRVLTGAGRASGSGRLGRTFQRGGRRAWAGCGSSALATQLSPRCTSFPQRPGTSHVKGSQRLGGSELRSGKWRCPVSIPQAGTALPPEPFNRE